MVWTTNIRNATFIALCWFAGYLNEFYVVRSVLTLTKREPLPLGHFVAAVAALAIDALVITYGYGLILAGASASFVLMDVLILRLR